MQLWRILYLRSVPVLTIQSLWEQDLGKEITQDFWEDILFRVHSSSISAGHTLVQCKVLHHTHWWKLALSKIYPDADPVCDRCKQAHASLMLWSCPCLTRGTSGALDLNVSVFAVTPGETALLALTDFVAFLTLLARCLILLQWKSVTLLSLRPGLQVFFLAMWKR